MYILIIVNECRRYNLGEWTDGAGDKTGLDANDYDGAISHSFNLLSHIYTFISFVDLVLPLFVYHPQY